MHHPDLPQRRLHDHPPIHRLIALGRDRKVQKSALAPMAIRKLRQRPGAGAEAGGTSRAELVMPGILAGMPQRVDRTAAFDTAAKPGTLVGLHEAASYRPRNTPDAGRGTKRPLQPGVATGRMTRTRFLPAMQLNTRARAIRPDVSVTSPAPRLLHNGIAAGSPVRPPFVPPVGRGVEARSRSVPIDHGAGHAARAWKAAPGPSQSSGRRTDLPGEAPQTDVGGASAAGRGSDRQARTSGVSKPQVATLHIDGTTLGRWAVQHLTRTLGGPAKGMTSVDPRSVVPRVRVAPF